MTNPSRLKAIYAELRRVARPDEAAGNLIRLAHMILRAYSQEVDETDEYGRPTDNRAFARLPVDTAMQDGGWRVLEFEKERRAGIEDVDPIELAVLHRFVKGFLGPEWQQQIPPG